MKLKYVPRSLRFKALFMIGVILVFVIGALTSYLTYDFTGSYVEAFLRSSFVVGEGFRTELSKSINLGLPLGTLGGVNEECAEILSKNPNLGYCIVTDTKAKVLFSNDQALVGTTMKDPVSLAAARYDRERYNVFTYKDRRYYDTVVPIKDAEDKHIGALRLGLSYEDVAKRKDRLLMRSALVGLASLAIAIVAFGFFITYFITSPIGYLVGAAKQIARGDLTKTIEVRTDDELGELGGAINTMVANLKNMLARVKEASISVAQATEKIAVNSRKVSEGAQAQQELTENTSSSMEEMNASIREVAESVESLSSSAESSSSSIMEMAASIDQVASSTAELSASSEAVSSSIVELSASVRQVAENVDVLSSAAEETTASATEMGASIKEVEKASKESVSLSERVTSEASELGMKSVEKTIESMEDIRETVEKAAAVIEKLGNRSEEIGEILNVIDEVTDQTSLLALNAAILAAQAGEHGKGFAVVATEIKDLAERTSTSTQEIAKLINAVQTEAKDAVTSIKSGKASVEQGVRIAYAAKEALLKIVEISTKAASMSKGIEKATVEQAEGIRQVSQAMMSISDMVQQILKATQEQSKGSEEIMRSSDKMSEIANQVRSAMAEQAKGSKQITMAVENVSDKVQHIASATSEQRKGSQEIVMAVGKIRDITSQNVGLAGEMDQAVRDLSNQADLLREEINRFVLMSDYNLSSGVLRLGITPLEEASVMKERFVPIAGYLESRLGVKVDVLPGKDLGSVVNDIGIGRTDVCFLGPTTYIEARHKYGAEALVKSTSKGQPFTRAVVVARQGSDIGSIKDLAGRTFAFGAERSTSAHLMPRAMLSEYGIKLQDLKAYKYLGRHDSVAKAVLAGEFDAGGLMEMVVKPYLAQGLKVVKYSDDIPNFTFVVGRNVDGKTKEKIKEALLEMRSAVPEHRAAFKAIDSDCEGFVEVKDSEYDIIRKMVKELYGIDYK